MQPSRSDSVAARITASGQPNPGYIGKSVSIKGEISGAEAMHIDGRVEGFIRLDGAYLNIGPGAMVKANINAREIVIRGEVSGNVSTTERLDIRSGGSLVGDIVAHSVSIEEGAYFKGSIDMRRVESARHQASKAESQQQHQPALAAVATA
jgi:cytoskeletal protein CcmA (bactofilin family)